MSEERQGVLRAFRNRNFALFFTGQGISQIGTWMQRTGLSWIVYTMTHSTFMLGVTVFASQFPSFLFSLPGGIVSDRYNRYKVLLITQIASMVQAVLLAVLTLTNYYSVWAILTLSVILGIINAFDVPVRQPMVHQMVNDPADLPNALAINSAMVNVARLVGPALSGIILQHYGAGICFLLNAVSFVAVISSLLMMRLPPQAEPKASKSATKEIAEGFKYLKRTPAISMVLLLLGLVSLLVLPYNTLLPVFAKEIYKGDAATFGYINSFIGLGAVAGTFMLAALKKGANLKKALLFSTLIMGVGLIIFAVISNFPLAMLFAIICGFGTMAQTTICITIVQVDSDAAMRGRMMSFVAMGYFGMLPLGSLLTGAASERIGPANTLIFEGIIALIIAAIFARFLRKDKLDGENRQQITEEENKVIQAT